MRMGCMDHSDTAGYQMAIIAKIKTMLQSQISTRAGGFIVSLDKQLSHFWIAYPP